LCKFLAIKAQDGLGGPQKKRTDSKKGPFFGRFGRKTGGVRHIKKAFYFEFFPFLRIFCIASC
jgi:hypothetical protein